MRRDGKQHRHSSCGPDPWQDAHRSSQSTTYKSPQQIHRRSCSCKTRKQVIQNIHYNHPVCVNPGKLIDKNLVNIQNTGAAIVRPSKVSTTQLRMWCGGAAWAGLALAWRKPWAAQAKHRAQLKIKPITVIRAALSNKPADIQTIPLQQGCSCLASLGSESGTLRNPPLKASQNKKPPHRSRPADTSIGKKLGPMPAYPASEEIPKAPHASPRASAMIPELRISSWFFGMLKKLTTCQTSA